MTFAGHSPTASGNPFLASISVNSFESSDGVSLAPVGGSTIFREVDEQESLSKVGG